MLHTLILILLSSQPTVSSKIACAISVTECGSGSSSTPLKLSVPCLGFSLTNPLSPDEKYVKWWLMVF